jgi:hypothetical protein
VAKKKYVSTPSDRAQSRAYQTALYQLRDQHRDEFKALLERAKYAEGIPRRITVPRDPPP